MLRNDELQLTATHASDLTYGTDLDMDQDQALAKRMVAAGSVTNQAALLDVVTFHVVAVEMNGNKF